MIKRFCDRCGKEVGVYKDIEFQTWWAITRHGMLDLTTELCDDCYQAKFVADTPQADLVEDSDDLVKDLVKDTPQTDNSIGCSKCVSRLWCMDRDMPHAVRCNNYGKITDEPQTDCGWK